MKARLQALVDFPITLDRPYKLCDYKPLWMQAFSEYLTGYDFCGYCDMDVVFGDIRRFLTEEALSSHDKIYELGHLTYYRNTEENLNRYKLHGGVDYRHAFTTEEIVAFDEIAGMQNIFDKNHFSTYKSRDQADITYCRVRFTRTDFRVPPDELPTNNYRHQVFYWENGRVYRAYIKDGQLLEEEFNYIHLSRRKMSLNDVNENDPAFFITSSGFWRKNGPVTKKDILHYEPYRPGKEWPRYIYCKTQKAKFWINYYWGILKRKLR